MVYPHSQAPLQSWLNEGLAAHRQGDIGRAIALYRQILAMAPEHGPALNLLGTGLLQLGQAGDAVPYLERAARRQRDNAGLLANLAQAYLGVGRFGEAADAFRKAARVDPDEAQFHIGSGAALALAGRLDEAEAVLRRCAARFARSPLAWLNLANVLRDRARLNDAAEAYGKALSIDSRHLEARNGLGSVLHALHRFAEAEAEYRAAIEIDPAFVPARLNLASVLIDVGRFAEAESVCRDIVARDPGSREGRTFLAAALGHQGRLVEAAAQHEAALRIAPADPRAPALYGGILMELGEAARGRRLLTDAIDRDPGNVSHRQTLATRLLAHGCLQDGWAEYATRPAAVRIREKNPRLGVTLPSTLEGRTVFVAREQGLGDEIFFLRYAAVLAGRGARVVYSAGGKIASLVARCGCIAEVVAEDTGLPDADAYILVGDLPHALGQAAASAMPARAVARTPAVREFEEAIRVYWPPVPRSLTVAPSDAKLREVRQRLRAAGPPPYVAVTWRAGTRPEEQDAAAWMLYKEVAVEALAQSVGASRGTVLALQRKPGAGEMEDFAAALGRALHDFTDLNDDLEGMLALLSEIDEYVGVSNTNVHLRALAGRTARVLVPAPAEWRWRQSGRASPWFPGFAIYRQTLQGDWSRALSDLARDLKAALDG